MRKYSYTLTLMLVFGFLVSCESTVQKAEVEDDQKQLIETAKSYLLANTAIQEAKFETVVEKDGFKAPVFRVKSEPNTLYGVFMGEDGSPKRVLIQQQEILGENNAKYLHYLGPQNGEPRKLVGTMTVNQQGKLLDYSTPLKVGGKLRGPCNTGTSCTSCHYDQMMTAIESNSDTRMMCDFLGAICNFQVVLASAAHCIKSH